MLINPFTLQETPSLPPFLPPLSGLGSPGSTEARERASRGGSHRNRLRRLGIPHARCLREMRVPTGPPGCAQEDRTRGSLCQPPLPASPAAGGCTTRGSPGCGLPESVSRGQTALPGPSPTPSSSWAYPPLFLGVPPLLSQGNLASLPALKLTMRLEL